MNAIALRKSLGIVGLIIIFEGLLLLLFPPAKLPGEEIVTKQWVEYLAMTFVVIWLISSTLVKLTMIFDIKLLGGALSLFSALMVPAIFLIAMYSSNVNPSPGHDYQWWRYAGMILLIFGLPIIDLFDFHYQRDIYKQSTPDNTMLN